MFYEETNLQIAVSAEIQSYDPGGELEYYAKTKQQAIGYQKANL